MYENRSEYLEAVNVLSMFEKSGLVEHLEHDLTVINTKKRSCRWYATKDQGEELFNEGQYEACKQLHQSLLETPSFFDGLAQQVEIAPHTRFKT